MAEVLEKSKYQLVIKVPFDALDNLQARQIAKGYLDTVSLPQVASVRLQRVHDRKPPEGVEL
jgi:hypothetical protein